MKPERYYDNDQLDALEAKKHSSGSLERRGSTALWEVTYTRGNWTSGNYRTYETLEELFRNLRGLADDPALKIIVERKAAKP